MFQSTHHSSVMTVNQSQMEQQLDDAKNGVPTYTN